MTSPGAAERAVEETVAQLGSLDILVNNVGVGHLRTGFADEPEESWAEIHELNLMAAIRTTRAALPHLVDGGGVVVNVFERQRSPSQHLDLCLQRRQSRAEQLHREPLPRVREPGVRVVGVAPGPVSTQMWLGPEGVAAVVGERTGRDPQEVVEGAMAEIPVRRTTAEEVGDLVAFLASSRAGTITGTTIQIDGGISPSV
jgi:NAD(P)-dependent dehydrogenase (short-subunit alcohol dehydrogenase family)